MKESNLEERVNLTFQREGASHDRVLEVGDGVADLVGLCEDSSKLEQDLGLLIEVRRHL